MAFTSIAKPVVSFTTVTPANYIVDNSFQDGTLFTFQDGLQYVFDVSNDLIYTTISKPV